MRCYEPFDDPIPCRPAHGYVNASRSKANPRRRNGYRRDRERARLKAIGAPCHLCGYPIDYEAPHLDKRAFVVDEIVPVSQGGKPYGDNCAAAHRCCNAWRGAKPVTPTLRGVIRARFEREVLGIGRSGGRATRPAGNRRHSSEW